MTCHLTGRPPPLPAHETVLPGLSPRAHSRRSRRRKPKVSTTTQRSRGMDFYDVCRTVPPRLELEVRVSRPVWWRHSGRNGCPIQALWRRSSGVPCELRERIRGVLVSNLTRRLGSSGEERLYRVLFGDTRPNYNGLGGPVIRV
jgi:hypothetical protein